MKIPQKSCHFFWESSCWFEICRFRFAKCWLWNGGGSVWNVRCLRVGHALALITSPLLISPSPLYPNLCHYHFSHNRCLTCWWFKFYEKKCKNYEQIFDKYHDGFLVFVKSVYFPIFCSVGICKSVRNVHPCFRLIFFHCCTDPLLLFNALDQFVPQMLSLPFREIVVKEGNCKYMLFLFQVIFTGWKSAKFSSPYMSILAPTQIVGLVKR